jgi:hypothetical protein
MFTAFLPFLRLALPVGGLRRSQLAAFLDPI